MSRGPRLVRAPGFHALANGRPSGPTRRRVVFLDRDGTIIHDRPGYYLAHPNEIRFYRGAFAALRALLQAGFELVVVSNQSGIARGVLDLPMLERVHARLLTELARRGVRLAGIHFCPHGPDDGCSCRKPRATLARRAFRRHGLSPEGAYVVGDKRADVDLARAIGATSVLLLTGHGRHQLRLHGRALRPDRVAPDLRAAARWILSRERRSA